MLALCCIWNPSIRFQLSFLSFYAASNCYVAFLFLFFSVSFICSLSCRRKSYVFVRANIPFDNLFSLKWILTECIVYLRHIIVGLCTLMFVLTDSQCATAFFLWTTSVTPDYSKEKKMLDFTAMKDEKLHFQTFKIFTWNDTCVLVTW